MVCTELDMIHFRPTICASLQWLPVKQRVDYRLAVIVYKTRSTGVLAYYFVDTVRAKQITALL